jgi:hypothetical protein
MTSPRLMAELQVLREIAEPVCLEAGVPWAVCVAQAWTESGLGRSELAQKAHNYHGIKYRKSAHDAYVWHVSPERTRKGVTKRDRMRFAAFATPEDGIRAWCDKVTSRRYKRSAEFGGDPLRFMAYLWARGWATANHYVEHFAGRLRALGRAINDAELAAVRIDAELEPCLDVLRETYGAERHKLGDFLAGLRFCWSAVPELDFPHDEP